jgi:hypothetical protein
LLKDSMKVTADKEKGKGERGKRPSLCRIVEVSTRLEGMGAVVNRF